MASVLSLTTQSLARQMLPIKNQADAANSTPAIAEQASTTFEQLEQIKHAFALKISEMSEIFNASRPNIYAWLKGSPPKDSAFIEKISGIAQVANRFASLSLTKPEAMLKRPVLAGNRTLFQCLIEEIDISDADLQILYKIDKREAAKRAETKPARKRHNDIYLLTTPISNNNEF